MTECMVQSMPYQVFYIEKKISIDSDHNSTKSESLEKINDDKKLRLTSSIFDFNYDKNK
jgi:hypothetical protein